MYIQPLRGLGQTVSPWPSGTASPSTFIDGMYSWIIEPSSAISSLPGVFSNLSNPVAIGLLAVPVVVAGALYLMMSKR